MSDVRRYVLSDPTPFGQESARMKEHEQGAWVEWTDYAALEKRVRELRDEITRRDDIIGGHAAAEDALRQRVRELEAYFGQSISDAGHTTEDLVRHQQELLHQKIAALEQRVRELERLNRQAEAALAALEAENAELQGRAAMLESAVRTVHAWFTHRHEPTRLAAVAQVSSCMAALQADGEGEG